MRSLKDGDFVVALMDVYEGGPAQTSTALCAHKGMVGRVENVTCGEECTHEDRRCCVGDIQPGYVVTVWFPGYAWSTDAVVGLEVRPLAENERVTLAS